MQVAIGHITSANAAPRARYARFSSVCERSVLSTDVDAFYTTPGHLYLRGSTVALHMI
ncbi:uncharacterized protein LAESUDRAFT_732976 [Laetiporus sulphureus 93-53]|uniref:Uncharacterized protein n=1 Tax=Laetiporus sulphureus 93-53 TaxID=1314785 RepID=A0A165AUB5_9APHY|nr:uncharacterized protein LAESUDRAFT_732976 [Laetiporus sulphureus 93-53]KZS99677.1 hypothetical protein LAESUDRAFT_732976 [Laetiporus sulphureus 93-53]